MVADMSDGLIARAQPEGADFPLGCLPWHILCAVDGNIPPFSSLVYL